MVTGELVGMEAMLDWLTSWKPPPCTMKPGTERWINELLYAPALTYPRKFATVCGATSGNNCTLISPRVV